MYKKTFNRAHQLLKKCILYICQFPSESLKLAESHGNLPLFPTGSNRQLDRSFLAENIPTLKTKTKD